MEQRCVSITHTRTNLNIITMQFKDYDADKIAAKLKQAQEFEAKFGAHDTSRGWIKWCTDVNYRKREWQWRQNIAKWHANKNKI